MIHKIWEVQHAGHTIRVENRAFSETLSVDGQVVQKTRGGLSTILRGSVAGEEVIAVITPRLLSVDCAIFVGRELKATKVAG